MAYDATDFTAPVRMLDRDPKSLTEPRERLEYLRDFLRVVEPKRFNMNREGYASDASRGECGTPACIGGWARALFRVPVSEITEVAPILGFSERIAWDLFYPRSAVAMSNGLSGFQATPTQAANVLDHLLKTGEVDWSAA